jgi:AMMECR1 domain-containing protein
MDSSTSSKNDTKNKEVTHYENPLLDKNYLSNKAKVICDDMIYYCFDILNSHLHKEQEPQRPKFTNNEFPLFVTWYIGRNLDLRGCIGNQLNTINQCC